jgi:hypothetical protein
MTLKDNHVRGGTKSWWEEQLQMVRNRPDIPKTHHKPGYGVTPSLVLSPFGKLPAELRLQVYEYLRPPNAFPSAYMGLRGTCRELQWEFDQEAVKAIRRLYAKIVPHLGGGATITPSSLFAYCMADFSQINMKIPLEPWQGPPGTFGYIRSYEHCYSWSWLKTLIIAFHIGEAATAHMDPIQVIHSQYRVGRSMMRRDFRLSLQSEIDTIVFQWSGKPKGLVVTAPENMSRLARTKELYRLMFRDHDRFWDTTLQFNAQGSFTKAVFRRRTQQEREKLQWLIAVVHFIVSWSQWLETGVRAIVRDVRRLVRILTIITIKLICICLSIAFVLIIIDLIGKFSVGSDRFEELRSNNQTVNGWCAVWNAWTHNCTMKLAAEGCLRWRKTAQ